LATPPLRSRTKWSVSIPWMRASSPFIAATSAGENRPGKTTKPSRS
jgi:hypothetical protein